MTAVYQVYEKIIKYIDGNTGKNITLDDISKFAGYSKWNIYRLFSVYGDISVMEYIRRKKLTAAADELCSGKKMFDIALDYGYETPAGFYKAFQALFGCSPSEYKNNILRSNAAMSTIEKLTKSIELDPSNAELYSQRAYAYARENRNGEALEDYNKTIELVPNEAWTYCGRAWFYHSQMHQHDKVIEDLSKAIELDPAGDISLYINRGANYELFKQYDKAEEDYKKAIEIAPDKEWGYVNLFGLYSKLNRHEKAAEQAEKIEEFFTSDNPAAYINMGWCFAHHFAMHEKAVELYSKALGIKPDSAWAYANRAYSYGKLGRHNEAIEDCIKSLELPYENPAFSHRNLGYSYAMLGQRKQAIEHYSKALELHPDSNDNAEVRKHLDDLLKK